MTLARAYEFGQFVEQDPERAFFWNRQGADIGLPDAQYKVSNAYRYGIGVEVAHRHSLMRWTAMR